ncbi:uncharacterized protein Triagg1_9235 [Trichoderma aggressivum f. europaeum]|uniref:Aminotransferase class I/classII large domain-containing protein n=1 Tax=Trichoderma aggressivum f. europaeum TaxID=173218 RepID=A0AAE1I7A3_9HYPO|nr:hypothetical protein Triagg1_9235 [Trichoderma aggressivum f. europaeum]
MEPTQIKVVFFDLDGTLFDHYHSLRLAISAMQRKYTGLAGINVEELINQYNLALQESYDAYLDKVITYEEADIQKIYLFFTSLGLPEPSLDQVQEFRDAYKAVYRENRRATPGTIEALARLREHGYRIAIITNGQIKDQAAKAKAIGILHLIDRIITSEETGYRKPDRRIFQYAIKQLNASLDTYMIGDSADSDIKGALDAQLAAILYSPTARNTQSLLFGQQIPVIRHLAQLLDYFNIPSHQFKPRFTSALGQLVIEGIGIDLVTERRHQAMFHIESMIRAISKAAGPIDEEAIQISFPGREVGVTMTTCNKPDYHVTDRDHSMRAEYVRLALDTVPENEGVLREVASLLQGHCNDLMRDSPRAAIRQLRCVMLILAEQAVMSISKEFGLPGLRIGFIAGNSDAINVIRIHNSTFAVMIPDVCQAAAQAALESFCKGDGKEDINVHVTTILKKTKEGWRSLGWPEEKIHTPSGGFKYLVSIPPGVQPQASFSGVELLDFYITSRANVKLSTSTSLNPNNDKFLRMVLMKNPSQVDDVFERLRSVGVSYDMVLPEHLGKEYKTFLLHNELWLLFCKQTFNAKLVVV